MSKRKTKNADQSLNNNTSLDKTDILKKLVNFCLVNKLKIQ